MSSASFTTGPSRVSARPRAFPLAIFLLLAAYAAAGLANRLYLPHVLELDEAEQIFHAQWLLLGYGAQPPLYNWLQAAVFWLTGPSVFGLALLKHILIFLIYVFYWLAADEVLYDRRLKIAAVLSLLTLPQVSYFTEQDLTHTVALLAATTLFLYAFFRLIARPTLAGYILVGIATGLGLLAKYNFALLPVAAFLAVLTDRDLRRRILDPRILVSGAIAGSIILPHGLWLIGHLRAATDPTLDKMTEDATAWTLLTPLQGMSSLLSGIVVFSLITVIAFVAIHGRETSEILRARSKPVRLVERMLAIMLLALVAIVLGTGATWIRERWLAPFLLVLPLYLALKIEASGRTARITRPWLLAIPLFIMVLVPLVVNLRVSTASLTGSYKRLNIPFDRLIPAVASAQQAPPAVILTNDRHLAGNTMLYWPGIAVKTLEYPEFGGELQAGRPVLLIWKLDKKKQMPLPVAAWLAQQDVPPATETLCLPYRFARDGDCFTLGYAALTIAAPSPPDAFSIP